MLLELTVSLGSVRVVGRNDGLGGNQREGFGGEMCVEEIRGMELRGLAVMVL